MGTCRSSWQASAAQSNSRKNHPSQNPLSRLPYDQPLQNDCHSYKRNSRHRRKLAAFTPRCPKRTTRFDSLARSQRRRALEPNRPTTTIVWPTANRTGQTNRLDRRRHPRPLRQRRHETRINVRSIVAFRSMNAQGSHPWLQPVATPWLSRLLLRESSVTLELSLPKKPTSKVLANTYC